MAHDGLSNVHPLMWGVPLVLALFYLIAFTAYECYKDFKDLKNSIEVEVQEVTTSGDDAETAADEATTAPPGAATSASSDGVVEAAAETDHRADLVPPARQNQDNQSQLDLAIDVMLCNYKDEGSDSGEGASTDTAPSVPPPPQSEGSAYVDEGTGVLHW